MQGSVRPLDVAVIILYLVAVTVMGAAMGTRQRTARDYFLGGRGLPWWAIGFSVVATETSALTVISLPATAYQGGFWFLQLALGYLVGRIVIAAVLLPRYFRGDLITAYALLEERFGPLARRFASLIFMVTRTLADSVRMFAAAIPVKLITGIPYWAATVVSGVVTVAYTYIGGLSAVVWVDVLQMAIYTFGGLASLYVLVQLVPGGWDGIVQAASEADKLQVFHWSGGFAEPRWVLTGLIGGAFLSMASHGVDHLIVQRLLAAKSLGDARKALVGSGIMVFFQFALFLFVGVALFAWYGGRSFATPDEIFPRFILESLPPGVSGLVVAGILAAMMSTVASSLNSLSSALANDVVAPLVKRQHDDAWLLRIGRRLTLFWAVILITGAIVFQFVQQGTPVVVIALQIASFTYGGLLGGFLLGIVSKRANERDALFAITTAIVIMGALWAAQQFGLIPRLVDTLWFSLIGSAITVAAGTLSARLRTQP
jgi:SSS family transporter